MSRRIGNVVVICPQENEKCEDCGKIEECRPYGPNGTNICFDCAQKDVEGTEKRMNQVLFGDSDA